jgi:hypothetical protein
MARSTAPIFLIAGAAGLGGLTFLASHTGASSLAPRSRIAPLKVVTCNDVTRVGDAPGRRLRVLFGRVAVPRQNALLQPHAAPANRPLPDYAKQGLQLHASRQPVEVVVPIRWRTRLAVGWGETGGPQQASVVRVLPCRRVLGHDWLTYPGGYFVRAPACVPLVIRTGPKTARVRLSVGRRCPRPR